MNISVFLDQLSFQGSHECLFARTEFFPFPFKNLAMMNFHLCSQDFRCYVNGMRSPWKRCEGG